MAKNREAATKKAVELLSKFAGYNDSVKVVESMLNNLTNAQFDDFMKKLRDGEEHLPYIMPNMNKEKLSLDTNLAIAKELDITIFQKLWLTDQATGEVYLTPKKYPVIDLPLRRLQQHLHKKINIPEDNRHIDDRTGQPTGPSKGSKLSYPELQLMYSRGMNESIRELFTVRGGDESLYRNMVQEALRTGQIDLKAIDDGDSNVKSTEVLGILLKAAHIDNNIAE